MRIVYLLKSFSLLTTMGFAAEETFSKHSLKCNMTQVYEEVPEEVGSIEQMFSQGLFYGRFRINSFGFKWDEERENRRKNHRVVGVGSSIGFQSGRLHGLSLGGTLHGTKAKGSLSSSDAGLYKAGKGVLNRSDVLNHSRYTMATFSEGYIAYNYEDNILKIGRQVFESFLTAGNDTKMIPNSFEGISLVHSSLRDTIFRIAYFNQQKLRDHTTFHRVFAYNGMDENDDSAMHRGLTTAKLKARGIKDRLLIFSARYRGFEDMMLQFNYTSVPELISSFMLQASRRVELGDWTLIPTVRYMRQLDKGAGAIAGANLRSKTSGYRNTESLESSLYGVRVDMVNEAVKWRLGYTQVGDAGDIVAPWRGFPTAGFTRAMGQYNWYANTKSYMLQLDYAFETLPDLKILSRFVVQDFDDKKIGVQADATLFSFDILKKVEDENLYFKTRYAHVMGDDDTIAANGMKKENSSYSEIRFEMNYLF